MISAKHPINDFTVYFDNEKHEYKIDVEKNAEYWQAVPSVTQFVNHYCPIFDADKISKHVAQKRGKTQAEILTEWESKKNHACEMGTRIHANQEKLIKGQTDYIQPADAKERAIMENGLKALRDMATAGFTPLDAEKMVFSPSLRLAGTIDAIFKQNRTIWIVDWKTNEKIERGNMYHNYMLPPCQDLEDCAYNHYALQLNLYERILKNEGYIEKIQKVKKMLVHLKPDEYEIIQLEDFPQADKMLLDYIQNDWFNLTPF